MNLNKSLIKHLEAIMGIPYVYKTNLISDCCGAGVHDATGICYECGSECQAMSDEEYEEMLEENERAKADLVYEEERERRSGVFEYIKDMDKC
jgi:hypothetical protein